jgi:8-oxo-dGTP pyrophosphatase MutT (NUDIX family)
MHMEPTRSIQHAGLDGRSLRARLRTRLDPWDRPQTGGASRSDIDLNPDLDLGAFEGLKAAAVLVGLVERAEGLSVLLTRRSETLRKHKGQIAFPGGGIDPGEAPWQAALREADEEVGLPPAQVELAGLSTPFMTLTGFHVTPVVGFIDPAFVARPSPHEVAEVFETPFAFLMDAANHVREFRQFAAGPPRWVYSISHDERVIWGITAAIIRDLYQRVFGDEAADV